LPVWHFFSVYTLFFGPVQVVSAAAIGAHLRFIVAVVTPPVVVAFIVASLDDLGAVVSEPAGSTPGPAPARLD
jgi:hypothetical protein